MQPATTAPQEISTVQPAIIQETIQASQLPVVDIQLSSITYNYTVANNQPTMQSYDPKQSATIQQPDTNQIPKFERYDKIFGEFQNNFSRLRDYYAKDLNLYTNILEESKQLKEKVHKLEEKVPIVEFNPIKKEDYDKLVERVGKLEKRMDRMKGYFRRHKTRMNDLQTALMQNTNYMNTGDGVYVVFRNQALERAYDNTNPWWETSEYRIPWIGKKRNLTNIVNVNVSIEPSSATQSSSRANKKGKVDISITVNVVYTGIEH